MITESVKNLFGFIDFLHSKTEYFLSKQYLVDKVMELHTKRSFLKPDQNFKDRIEYNKVQAELEKQFAVLKKETTIIIVEKIQELSIANISTPILNLNAQTDLFELQRNFNEDDLVAIFEAKRKYLEFRTRTNFHYFLEIFFQDLDRDLKEFFDYFKETKQNEFEAFETKTVQVNSIRELVDHFHKGNKIFSLSLDFMDGAKVQKGNKEPMAGDKTTDEQQHFEREFEKAQIPFSNVITGDALFKQALFRQYCKVEKKPCFDLYLADFYSKEELKNGFGEVHKQIPVTNTKEIIAANFTVTTPFETRINELSQEFSSKVGKNELPSKYYCPDIEKTPIVKALRGVNQEYELLKKSVFDVATDKYKEAEIRAKNVTEISERLKGFSLAVIEHLEQDNKNIYLYVRNADGEKFELWQTLKSNFNSSLKSMNKQQTTNTKGKKSNGLKELAFTELLEIAVSRPEPERSSRFNELLTTVKDEFVKANIELVKKRIDEALITIEGFTKSEIEHYQSIFANEFYFVLHSPNYTVYIEDKLRELHFHIKSLELDFKTKQYEYSEERDMDKEDLIEAERYKLYLENLLAHFLQNGANKDLLSTAKNVNEFTCQKNDAKETPAPVVKRFCELVNDSKLLERGFDESSENFCKRVCSKYELRYRTRVSKYFTSNNAPKSTDSNLRKVIERILPNIPDTDRNQIEAYINNNKKMYV